jgi:thiol-disulfide isomerase/thioredoxin
MMAVALCTIGLTNVHAQSNQQADKTNTLKVGDPAPPIVVRKWIKRGPVTKFKPGMVYVVEFWATWCGPCQAAMPHLSELAEKYKGKAEVLSIDVMENKKTDFLPKVERLVKWSGDRMDYTVAVDAPGEIMEKTWLKAAGANGIPELFIIDQQGKIAWHGHPNFVDEVLDAVVNGSYDEAGKKRIEAAAKAKQERYDSLGKAMMTAWKKDKDYPKALAIAEEILPLYPGLCINYLSNKYEFLSHIDSLKARKFGEELMAQWSAKDQLSLAYFILHALPDSSYKPDYDLALKLVNKAVTQSDPQDRFAASMLADVNYKTGNKEKAIKYQKKFIQILKNDPAITPKMLEPVQKTLQRYESSEQ